MYTVYRYYTGIFPLSAPVFLLRFYRADGSAFSLLVGFSLNFAKISSNFATKLTFSRFMMRKAHTKYLFGFGNTLEFEPRPSYIRINTACSILYYLGLPFQCGDTTLGIRVRYRFVYTAAVKDHRGATGLLWFDSSISIQHSSPHISRLRDPIT